MKNQLVTDTVTEILKQVGADDRFRADFEKAIAAVFDAGAASSPPAVTMSLPLSNDEIALIRAKLSA